METKPESAEAESAQAESAEKPVSAPAKVGAGVFPKPGDQYHVSFHGNRVFDEPLCQPAAPVMFCVMTCSSAVPGSVGGRSTLL